MVDLFTCLNLNIKNQDCFYLDDFLYFFDNFSFSLKEQGSFEKLAKEISLL